MNNTEPVYPKKKRVLVFWKSHICSARLGLPSWKKNMSLFCAALSLTLCVWRMCGEPRLAFCWPFKFKIQSAARARPHRGDGTNFLSLCAWRYLFLFSAFTSCCRYSCKHGFIPPSFFSSSPKAAIEGNDAVCYRDSSRGKPG